MLRPSVAGRLLQALLPRPGEAVLEIGAGSGFVTACLRAMAAPVRSLEIFPELADAARRNLAALGMRMSRCWTRMRSFQPFRIRNASLR